MPDVVKSFLLIEDDASEINSGEELFDEMEEIMDELDYVQENFRQHEEISDDEN